VSHDQPPLAGPVRGVGGGGGELGNGGGELDGGGAIGSTTGGGGSASGGRGGVRSIVPMIGDCGPNGGTLKPPAPKFAQSCHQGSSAGGELTPGSTVVTSFAYAEGSP